jgi:thiamine-phosphate pyrophosphorylase
MKPLAECALYTFVDSAYLHGRDPLKIGRALCEGGSDLIQLRAKDWPLSKTQEVAVKLADLTSQFGIGLVINDHLALAQEVGADFCHLGQEDFFDAGYRSVNDLPQGATKVRIGLSTHAPDQAKKALAAGADYFAIGPVFPTDTKPSAKAVTLEYVRWAAANVTVPWFAIGGINLTNLSDVLAAGARRVCVVSAILNSEDIAATVRKFKQKLPAPRPEE